MPSSGIFSKNISCTRGGRERDRQAGAECTLGAAHIDVAAVDLRALARHLGTAGDMATDAVAVLAQAGGQCIDVVLQFQRAEHAVELAAPLRVGAAQGRRIGHEDVRLVLDAGVPARLQRADVEAAGVVEGPAAQAAVGTTADVAGVFHRRVEQPGLVAGEGRTQVDPRGLW
ncbi:hypothetical protein G6F50_014714 [Rhizopus delemar]|uniref:Uncharacterized protein n=1 Tax=Rhizopus delemar TaxID=936053 RepID=A0A9P6Y301_9FUNG|nr:hypothetical protein G6F50_014714 [Rhizopus delemar]